MKQPVIIIGMYQSGTDLVSEMLSHAGIFMGNDLNENGNSELFGKLNKWMFAQAGATWDNPCNFDFVDEDFSLRIAKSLKGHLKGRHLKPFLDETRRKYSRVDKFDFDWAWADPLNTFTIEIWKKIFTKARIIHVYRNPMDVAASLKIQNQEFRESVSDGIFKRMKRRNLERRLSSEKLFRLSLRTENLEESFQLWNQYLNKEMNVEETTGFDTYHICYEDLVHDFKSESEKLFKFLGFTIPDGAFLELQDKVKKEKCFAFLKDDDLNEFYQSIKNQSLMAELNYHEIN